jgi:transcriptional regulator with XRE-family HTH domain
MAKNHPKKAAKAPGRPRLVNQVLVNRMVALREQGFSHREIAQKVGRSERTVRRYTKGVSPRVELPTQPKRVDVLAACGRLILDWRKQLELDTEEVDAVLKELRKALDRKDPLTLEWFAIDARARLDFMLHAFLRQVMPGINTMRHIRRIREELRACGGQVIEEGPEDPGPPPSRVLLPRIPR